jgi:CRP-like cAMP-binding protein
VSTASSSVALLDADPELGAALPAEERRTARRALVFPALALEPGMWTPPEDLPMALVIGLIMLAGVMSREIAFAARRTTELLGDGDVIVPWDDVVGFQPLRADTNWRVHSPTRLAVLDSRFARACGRWPGLASALGARQARRNQALARRLALTQIPAIPDRLLVLLWELAGRWGQPTPGGVLLPLPLTHGTLAAMLGALRPSVTTAVGTLAREGLIERTPTGWVLHGGPEVAAQAAMAHRSAALRAS